MSNREELFVIRDLHDVEIRLALVGPGFASEIARLGLERIEKRGREALVDRLTSAKVGDPSRDDVQVGPVATKKQQEDVLAGIQRFAAAGAKIWVDNRVDFSNNANLIVAAGSLVLGTGDFTLKFGGFALGGIGTATFGAILLYALLARRR